jgi:predicted nucleic acid-binding protein
VVVSPTRSWLIDKSALIKLTTSPDFSEWIVRVNRGLVRVAFPTLLEVGFSARNAADWHQGTEGAPVASMPRENVTPAMEERGLHVQGMLASLGHHRAPSIPDLQVAAVAEIAGLTVLHVDKDFELIAEVTGQPIERLRLPE